jgi:hypothetical protein
MTVTAGSDGRAIGKFHIPSGVPTGTKLVRFIGGFGSMADAYYTGTGQVINTSITREIEEIYQPAPTPKPIVAGDLAVNTRKNTALTVTAADGLLSGCSSPNGGILTITNHESPARGAVSVATDGSFIYTPTTNLFGLDFFRFECGDGTGATGWAVVLIEVLDTHQPPIANDDNWEATFQQPVTGNVITNDSSPDGLVVALTQVFTPSHGTITAYAPDGSITYSPASGFSGVASFNYTLTDSLGAFDTATVWVHVGSPPPVAVSDEVNVPAVPIVDQDTDSYGIDFVNLPSTGMVFTDTTSGLMNSARVRFEVDVMRNDLRLPPGTIITSVTQPHPSGRLSFYSTQIIKSGTKVLVMLEVVGGAPWSAAYDTNFSYTVQTPDGAQTSANVRLYCERNIFQDPLAQTFTFDRNRQVHGVDVWVATKGRGPIAIEIRDVVYGIPDQQPLLRGSIALNDIVEGAWNRILFPTPFLAIENKNYAFVAMCGDSVTELATAEIAKYDLDAHEWVSAQPYNVGVMMTSSNNATWTAHQNTDLAFRLLTGAYTTTTSRITLGLVTVTGDTDFCISANINIPSPACSVKFELTMPDASVHVVSAHQPLSLSAAQPAGSMTVVAILTGTSEFTPILYRDVTVLHGPIGTSGTYASRSMPITGGVGRIRCIYEALLPSGSGITAAVIPDISGSTPADWVSGTTYTVGNIRKSGAVNYICINSTLGHETQPQTNTTYWSTVIEAPMGTASSTAALDNGYIEYTHELTAVNGNTVKVRLNLTGSAAARPNIKNFRAMVM